MLARLENDPCEECQSKPASHQPQNVVAKTYDIEGAPRYCKARVRYEGSPKR